MDAACTSETLANHTDLNNLLIHLKELLHEFKGEGWSSRRPVTDAVWAYSKKCNNRTLHGFPAHACGMSKTSCNARVHTAVGCRRFPGARHDSPASVSSQRPEYLVGFIGPIPVLLLHSQDRKGLSNVHMQPADPGSGKGMEILAPIKAGTPAPCHSRQNDLPFGRSNQSAGPASGNRAATRHA